LATTAGNGFQSVQELHPHSPDSIGTDAKILSSRMNRNLLKSILDQLIPFGTILLGIVGKLSIVDHSSVIAGMT